MSTERNSYNHCLSVAILPPQGAFIQLVSIAHEHRGIHVIGQRRWVGWHYCACAILTNYMNPSVLMRNTASGKLGGLANHIPPITSAQFHLECSHCSGWIPRLQSTTQNAVTAVAGYCACAIPPSMQSLQWLDTAQAQYHLVCSHCSGWILRLCSTTQYAVTASRVAILAILVVIFRAFLIVVAAHHTWPRLCQQPSGRSVTSGARPPWTAVSLGCKWSTISRTFG